MILTIKCDLYKSFLSLSFLAAILVTFLLCFTESVYTDVLTARAYSVFEALFKFDRVFMENSDSFCSLSVFKSALSGYSAMFLPILASFPFVFSQTAERNSGNIRFSIFRSKRLRYYLSKFFCAVLSGGVCVMLGVALFGIFSFLAFPALDCYPTSFAEYCAPDGVWAEVLRKIISSLIYGAVSAIPAFFLSAFCRNFYITLCVPFLLRFIQDTAIRKVLADSKDYEDYSKIFPFRSYAPSQIPYLKDGGMLWRTVAVVGVTALLLLIGYIVIMECRTDKGE